MLKKIQEKIEKAGTLTSSEKKEFMYILSFAPEEYLFGIIDMFEENEKWIKWLYMNYKNKQEAFLSNNNLKWGQIFEEEKSVFENSVVYEV